MPEPNSREQSTSLRSKDYSSQIEPCGPGVDAPRPADYMLILIVPLTVCRVLTGSITNFHLPGEGCCTSTLS